MSYEKPKIDIVIFEALDVIRTSLIPGVGSGPDIEAPGTELIPGTGGGSDIPVGNF